MSNSCHSSARPLVGSRSKKGLDMSAILDFHGYCEIETDGGTGVTIIRHKAWLTIFRWRWNDGLWRAVVVAP
jgi:hypothetical protein